MNLRNITLAMMGALALASCTKEVELNPTYTVNGDASFKTIEDYEAALTGAYARLKANSYYGSTSGSNAFVGLPDMMSDNLYESSESLANYTILQRWRYTADEVYVEDTWLDGYTAIQQANLAMRNIDKLAANAGAVARIKGQALALRAHVHFDLLRYFGEEFDRNSNKLGVPYVETFDIEQKPARLSVKASYDKIEADLKAAKSLLSATDRSIQSITSNVASNRAYVDTLVVNAMLARMYTYAGVPDSAIRYATFAINARPLATAATFPQIWQDASTAEVIWSVKFENGNSDIGGNMYYVVGNRASYRPTTSLVALYDQVNDVRFGAYFQNRVRSGASRLVLGKYLAKQARQTNPDGIVDFKVFRTGEMYLIRAEAQALKGNDIAALADLNTLRAARNAAVGVETGTALQLAIANERRKELVAEGHRFFDLKRTTRQISRTTNCTNFCTLPATDRAWAFPIPQTEITANNAMTQNTGY